LLDGEEHGHAGGLVDVDAVYRCCIDLGNAKGEGEGADFEVEGFALVAGELLGVLEAHAGEDGGPFRQDDGGGDDGAEECAAADLVDAGDEAEAVIAEGLLGGVGADKLLQHLLLGRGFRGAGADGSGEERGHG